MPSNRLLGLGVTAIAGYVAIAGLGDQRLLPLPFQIIFWFVFAVYLLAAWVAWQADAADRRALTIVMLVAVIIRLMMVVCPPTLSDDIYRYAWDGKIQTAGYNPYLYAATDPILKPLRDRALYDRLSSRYTRQPAVYPPVAEALFFLTALPGVAPVFLLKLLLALADIGSVWLLVLILRQLKLNPLRAVIYAWSPLAVIEVSQSGHIEGLAVLLTLAAVLAVLKGKDMLGGGFAALAVAAKAVPAVFLPALYRKKDWRFPTAFALILAVACLPYARGVKTLFGLATEGSNLPRFNAGIKLALEAVAGRGAGFDQVYSVGAIIVLGAVGLAIWRRQDGTDARTMNGLFIMAALFLVVTPFLPSWYVLIIVPFLAWRPSPAYIWLSGGVMLHYLIYLSPAGGPTWPGFVEYGVFFALVAVELAQVWNHRNRRLTPPPAVARIVQDL